MIALVGPTKLDLELPADNSVALIEIAFLIQDEEIETVDGFSEAEENIDCHELAPWETELIGERLAELHAAGVVRRRLDGRWLVYEVTPDICRMLLLLLLKRSSTPKPKAW